MAGVLRHRRTVRTERARDMSGTTITRQADGRMFELVGPTYGKPGTVEVYETTTGKPVPLTRDVDLPYADDLSDEVLLALAEPRRIGLATIMAQYGIVSGPDYQYDDEHYYELLYSTAPVGRYVVVSGDETHHWIDVVDTREDAAKSVAGDIEDQMGNEYPHHPIEIRDLDTGRSIPFKYEVVVELSD
jgi:hypothetical protein